MNGEKPIPINLMTLAQLQELINRLIEESPEAESKINEILNQPVCMVGDILLRVTKESSYAIYQASTMYNNKKHYCVLHNLWTGRTRTIMGNTEENLITAEGYDERPLEWSYGMLEQACRHHKGLIPGNLKKIGSLIDIQNFLTSLKT